MSGKKTPRYLIQEYADNADTEKSTHPARRRRPLVRTPEVGSISQPTVSSTTLEPTRSGTKRKRSAAEEEFTPRHLIQGILDTQDTAKPSTRKSKKVVELLPPSSNRVKKSRQRSSLGVPSLEKIVSQDTPRSAITGFLEQGVEETPVQKAAKGDRSTSRSSFGDLPNNEISFHPIEANFRGSKSAKVTKKTKGDRSRAAIHIVKRRSEKLARGAGEEIDFSDDEASDETSEQYEGTEQEREDDESKRKSGYISDPEIDDTSDKDTSSVDPSPRKSLSHRRVTPSKRESIISLKNVSEVTPSKTLSVSTASVSHTSSRKKSSKSKKSQQTKDSDSESPSDITPSKSRSRSSHARLYSTAEVVAEVNEDVDDELAYYPDESVKSHGNVSRSKSRRVEVAEGSDLEPSPRNKARSRSRAYDHTPTKKGGSLLTSSRTISDSRFEEGEASSIHHDDTRLSCPGPSSKSRSRLDMTTGMSPERQSRSGSKSRPRSKKADRSDNEDEEDREASREKDSKEKSHLDETSKSPTRSSSNSKSGSKTHGKSNKEEEKNEAARDRAPGEEVEEESHEFPPHVEIDEPRSGRSSPRHSTGLVTNVYDFHDDSPSKRIIGKLAKTLQKSASGGGEKIINTDNEDDDNEEAPHFDHMQSDSVGDVDDDDDDDDDDGDLDHYGEEPEESIIPKTDRETRTYYTPLRTPHLKEKTSSKPVSMVTSTPKPVSQTDKPQAAARGKGRQRVSGKKKDTGYMPTSVVKGLFSHFCPSKVSKEAVAEIEKASAQFWEHAAKDLESYALHAHRKTIEEADVELLMKRQKFITAKESLPSLVEKYLPLELRQEIIPICRSGNKLELK